MPYKSMPVLRAVAPSPSPCGKLSICHRATSCCSLEKCQLGSAMVNLIMGAAAIGFFGMYSCWVRYSCPPPHRWCGCWGQQ